MKTVTKSLVALLLVGPFMQPINADHELATAAGTAVGLFAGYGIYKGYESWSYSRAQGKVDELRKQLAAHQSHCCDKYAQSRMNKETLFTVYRVLGYERFEMLCFGLEADIVTCETLLDALTAIKRTWNTTAYAQPMVQDIDMLVADIGALTQVLAITQELLKKVRPIVTLETLTHTPTGKKINLLLQAPDDKFDLALMQTYGWSQWPYLAAYNDVTWLLKLYRENYAQAYALGKAFPKTIERAKKLVALHTQLQNHILVHPRYTQDKQYKQQYDNEQERLRIEREQLAAARAAAEAARQAAMWQQINALNQHHYHHHTYTWARLAA